MDAGFFDAAIDAAVDADIGVEIDAAVAGMDASTTPEDAGSPIPWGAFAAALPIAPCPTPALQLTVTTTTEELDGDTSISDPAQAGPTLSLREALWIASNRSGPKSIFFDAAVFPMDAPATIAVTQPDSLAEEVSETCIDGRGRGVVIRWADQGGLEYRPWDLGNGCLQVGLTLLNIPYEQNAADAQVAGCRLDTDGTTARHSSSGERAWILQSGGRTRVGPGNVIAKGIRVWSEETTISGNYFDFDPVTGVNLRDAPQPSRGFIDARVPFLVEDNVFANADLQVCFLEGTNPLRFTGNHVGVDRDGRPLPGSRRGFTGLWSFLPGLFVVIGPDNTIRGVDTAITLDPLSAVVTVTKNSITGNAAGVAFSTPPTVQPPEILSTSPEVTGSCSAAGLIELFVDPGDQGETHLTSTPCTVAGGFRVTVDLATYQGLNLTAILTAGSGQTSGFSAPFPL